VVGSSRHTGDGMLVEFASVVDALRCADRGSGGDDGGATPAVPADIRIEFRVGIHQGDIVVEDATSSATARKQSPHGLKVWRRRRHLRVGARGRRDAAGKLDLAFEDHTASRSTQEHRPAGARVPRPIGLPPP